MKDQLLSRTRLRANQLRRLLPKLILNRLSLACVIAVFVCGAASGQIKFVQITDPHLYDDGQETENKRALAVAVTKINTLIDFGGDYRFVVVTGDIGIEKLVKPLLDQQEELRKEKEKAEQKDKAAIQEKIDRIDRAIPLKITGAALEVANILGQSKMKAWLFLPGNNDLIDEKTDTIKYYRDFIEQLRQNLPGKDVIDLCPTDTDPKSGVYSAVDGFAFIGFNNASFKNNNDAQRISSDGKNIAAIVARTDPQKCEGLSTAEEAQADAGTATPSSLPMTLTTGEQLKYVQQVVDRIGLDKKRRAYVFYHIPEIDDPYAVLEANYDLLANRKLTRSDQYALSSWFVDGCVRLRWAKVVTNDRVSGLFAGHFHDWRRRTYENFRWLVTPDYPGGTLTKLYVCPPLAIKRQDNQPAQARGFQAVSIDGTGKVAVNVFWYDAASATFAGPGEAQVASMSGGWRVVSSLAGYVWGSIPSYLPFYLIVIVGGYAAIRGWKRTTVISPFHVPFNNKLCFGEDTVANSLHDAFTEIRRKAEIGLKDSSHNQIGPKEPGWEGLKLPVTSEFEVPARFSVEVKGLSHEALISFGRKVFGKERVISGDVIVHGNTFCLLARGGTSAWSTIPKANTVEGLREACHELALKALTTIDPMLLAAHEIGEEKLKDAYGRLHEMMKDV